MKSTMIKGLVAAGMIANMAVSAFAGGNITFNWDNDGLNSGNDSFFFSDKPGLVKLPAGSVVQLVAIQGGTNYVLASSTIGTGGDPIGEFNATSVVASQIMNGAVGSVMGMRFFNAPTATGPSATISNLSILVPTPNFPGAPPAPTTVEADVLDVGWLGLRTDNGAGFYLLVPEPSSIMLVSMGLLGMVGLMRRRRS